MLEGKTYDAARPLESSRGCHKSERELAKRKESYLKGVTFKRSCGTAYVFQESLNGSEGGSQRKESRVNSVDKTS